MKVKYVVCYEAIHEDIWLRNFIVDFNIIKSILMPLTIYYDNIIVVSFSLYNKTSIYMKHFDVKYQFVRKKIREHITYVEYVSMNRILIDPITNGIVIGMHHDHAINYDLAKPFDILG